jgi:phosphate-selective porin OprO/OprP
MYSARFTAVFATLVSLALAAPSAAEMTISAGSVPETTLGEIAPTEPRKTESEKEWQLTPRLRLQYDVASLDGPKGLIGTGNFADTRRARVGVDLKMPHGFAARLDTELSTDPITLADAYVQWSNSRFKVVLGQQKAQLPLDEDTGTLNTSFLERAAFVSAFGYSRRTGISGHYISGDFGVSGGIYTDPLISLNDVATNSSSVDVRTHWSPRFATSTMHFGAAYHWRDLNDIGNAPIRYLSRPALRIADTRYIGTPVLSVEKEQRFGLEAAAVHGRLHLASEVHWLKAQRDGFRDPIFFGAYAEVGIFLTKDSRPLKGGLFGAIKPGNPLGGGGIGALQFNLRYDFLDLNSSAVIGGVQNGYLASLIWTPVENFRLMGQYARLNYSDTDISVSGRRSYGVNIFAVRGQISF